MADEAMTADEYDKRFTRLELRALLDERDVEWSTSDRKADLVELAVVSDPARSVEPAVLSATPAPAAAPLADVDPEPVPPPASDEGEPAPFVVRPDLVVRRTDTPATVEHFRRVGPDTLTAVVDIEQVRVAMNSSRTTRQLFAVAGQPIHERQVAGADVMFTLYETTARWTGAEGDIADV